MKIEVAPWIKEYVTDMGHLYTELTVEHVQEGTTQITYRTVKDYKEMLTKTQRTPSIFEKCFGSRESQLLEKVLAKGDPGMGKTTLAKKIAWGWAKMTLTRFSVVFFVFLKLVNPGDTIENVIIQQRPELEGMGVTSSKIQQILDKFGSECLLILDGLDEHALGQNFDVKKIIEGKKLLYCNIFLTSRPHSTLTIEKYFGTKVRVNGFTLEQAKIFARKILGNENQVQNVLNFKPAGYRQDIALHRCPILLSFMCLLVRHDEIDLSSETIDSGEFYARMVRCLYKKFLVRQMLEFDENDFVAVMRKIGKLALETLVSGKPLLKRSDVTNQVGADAFDYGLLIGHEDFRLIADEAADIFVTFPHRSIQEFLGAFYFILCLIEGVSVQLLLGDVPEKSLFFTNPLFFYFANWLVCSSKNYFPTIQQKCAKARQILKLYILEQIDDVQLDLRSMTEIFPSLNIRKAKMNGDEASLAIWGEVLADLQNVQDLKLYNASICEVSKWILRKIPQLFQTTLRSITVTEKNSYLPCTAMSEFSIVLHECFENYKIMKTLLQLSSEAALQASVYIIRDLNRGLPDPRFLELSTILHENMKSLHILDNSVFVTTMNIVKTMPLEYISLGKARVSLVSALSRLAQSGGLSRLTHLSIPAEEWGTEKPIVGFLFDKAWPNLTHLTLTDLGSMSSKEFSSVTKQGKLKNVTGLSLCSRIVIIDLPAVDWLRSEFLPILKELTLHRFIKSVEIFEEIATILQQGQWCLQKVDLSHSLGMKGNLSTLLKHRFPELNTLILSKCELNCVDLMSLAQANVEGNIPELKHLDISLNDKMCDHLNILFDNSSPSSWNGLLSLNVERSQKQMFIAPSRSFCSPDLELLRMKTSSLKSLKELRVSAVNNKHMRITSR